jgi:ABC-2 type transport system permease protein
VPTIFRYSLARLRGQVIGWGLVFLLIGWPLVSVYDSMMKLTSGGTMEAMMAEFKPMIAAMAPQNVDFMKVTNPDTFLSLRYFSLMPIILGIYAVINGSGLLAADEENGTLDLLLAHPVTRTGLFLGRLLALLAATVFILTIAWVGLLIPMSGTALGEKVSPGQVLLPFLSLLSVLLFFICLALLLSMVLPSRRLTAMATGFFLLAGFFLTAFARVNPDLEVFACISPLNYYQGGEAINGLNGAWLGGLLAVAVLFAAVAWWAFECRDIRVSGEGGWRWPILTRKRVTS